MERLMENEVEVVETTVATVDENSLGLEVTDIEQQATALTIETGADYMTAGSLAKIVKATQKKVEDYWEPMRASTYTAYKAVTDHKKAMTDPLKNAETIIKRKMGQFQMEQERKRREEEERLKALARAEMERKLKEAAEAEKAGDETAVESAMAEAEVMETMAATAKVDAVQVKAQGISQTKSWEITGIDLKELPVEFGGIVIRPADERAILNIIKMSKGNVTIPGVQFSKKVNIAVRVG